MPIYPHTFLWHLLRQNLNTLASLRTKVIPFKQTKPPLIFFFASFRCFVGLGLHLTMGGRRTQTHTFGWIARMGAEVAGLYSHDDQYLSSECAARARKLSDLCAARAGEDVGLLIDKKHSEYSVQRVRLTCTPYSVTYGYSLVDICKHGS